MEKIKNNVSKSIRRKIMNRWENKCAICANNDILEIHHIIPLSEGGDNAEDNLILLCACCHAAVHQRAFSQLNYHKNYSIDYKSAIPVLQAYFNKEIGAKETKERLNLSPKTHLSESAVYKRYKREFGISPNFKNTLDMQKKRRTPDD